MENMEIEKKYIIKTLPENLDDYSSRLIEQGYLNTDPVVRVRRDNNDCYLTYKGGGMMAREEYNLPLNAKAYAHLIAKADGNIISKTRYMIPLNDKLTIELDIFHGQFEGLCLAEVEFDSIEEANSFIPPLWFGEDVTMDGRYHNSYMSQQKL